MASQQSVEVPLESSLIDEIDRLASAWGKSREHVLQVAVMRLIDNEAPLDDQWRDLPVPPPRPGLEVMDEAHEAMRRFIQEGLDAVDRGEVVSHEEVFTELRRGRRKNAA